MKTLEQLLTGYTDETIDDRQSLRLANFLKDEDLHKIQIELTEDAEPRTIKEWTRENILAQLEEDVEFGFKKALRQRGISAALMFDVVLFWNQVLEEGLEDWDEDNYAMYGLPLFKATAIKYGWEDQIDGYEGNEVHFNE